MEERGSARPFSLSQLTSSGAACTACAVTLPSMARVAAARESVREGAAWTLDASPSGGRVGSACVRFWGVWRGGESGVRSVRDGGQVIAVLLPSWRVRRCRARAAGPGRGPQSRGGATCGRDIAQDRRAAPAWRTRTRRNVSRSRVKIPVHTMRVRRVKRVRVRVGEARARAKRGNRRVRGF